MAQTSFYSIYKKFASIFLVLRIGISKGKLPNEIIEDMLKLFQKHPSIELEISIEPWKKLVIHEVVEYEFEEWLKQIAFSAKTSGGTIPTMQWADGVVISSLMFPTTNSVMEDQMKGILHWSSVSFAIKEKFEKEVIRDHATVDFVDVSVNETFRKLAAHLKKQSKFLR